MAIHNILISFKKKKKKKNLLIDAGLRYASLKIYVQLSVELGPIPTLFILQQREAILWTCLSHGLTV